MQIDHEDVLDLISEAGQTLALETPDLTPTPIDQRYGSPATRAVTTQMLQGYIYSEKIKANPMDGAATLTGAVIAIVSAKGVIRSDFAPGCVLIADDRRYRVEIGSELKHRNLLLAFQLKLTSEEVPNGRA